MVKTSLFFALMEVATANPAGFTVDANTLQPIRKGYAVACAETQNSFGGYGLLKVMQYQQSNPASVQAFGGWLDSKSNKFYFDATIICDDLETAQELGRRNGQIAIFDLENLEEIRL